MENLGFKERRAFARFPVKMLLRYFNLNLLGEAHAQTQDISAKGLCLVTREALAANTPLDIWLQMPDNSEQIYITGKVIWSNMTEPDKYKVGISLENTELNPILLALKAIQVCIRHY
ncbi:MAG: hypothetical protein COX40_01665 [Candidatus Omnitrophica bacterium CG23_combo_of_CG06-09_8_20_14_all_40_11]|nr:MAG: hypothetical protein COX40_01665 [Candidatus Omnitrophica bacterium CG23_combo_of_CG06-09_8_20_14_all_40_11]